MKDQIYAELVYMTGILPISQYSSGSELNMFVEQDAIRQIKEKKYSLRFKGKLGEPPKYTGHIIAVGISYSRVSKKHCCETELLES